MEESQHIPEGVRAGQAVYSRRVLAVYDWFVLGFSNSLIWRCPTARLLDLYRSHVTTDHLEVGPGTGYFLDHCRFPAPTPRLVLLDVNRNCLDVAAARVQRLSPTTVRANVLEPLPPLGEPFGSVGIMGTPSETVYPVPFQALVSHEMLPPAPSMPAQPFPPGR